MELPMDVGEVLGVRVEQERAEERARPVGDRELVTPPAHDGVESVTRVPVRTDGARLRRSWIM